MTLFKKQNVKDDYFQAWKILLISSGDAKTHWAELLQNKLSCLSAFS
jgi:hypothetical protein